MRKVLYVSPSGNVSQPWKVQWEGTTQAMFFRTKDVAVAHARHEVGKYHAGYCSQIKIRRADGTFQIEWTYGKDPFPPRG